LNFSFQGAWRGLPQPLNQYSTHHPSGKVRETAHLRNCSLTCSHEASQAGNPIASAARGMFHRA
jgi:hypothetical protein